MKSLFIILVITITLNAQDSTFQKISRMRDSVSVENITRHIENLQSAGGHNSRVTFTPGNDSAALYIRNEFAKIPGVTVKLDTFFIADADSPYNQKPLFNVIAAIPGKRDSSKTFILGAHYDDSGSRMGSEIWIPGWDTLTVPGADDNATGVAGIIEIARLLCDTSISFYNDYTITLIAYNAEESNPVTNSHHYGSMRHAQYCVSNNIQVTGMISFDMVGYNENNFYTSIAGNQNSVWLGQKINGYRNIFDIPLSTNNSVFLDGDYSDHYSYELQGYKAVLLIENSWPWSTNNPLYIPNPFYHKSTDSLHTVNLELTKRVTQLALVSAAAFAGILSSNEEEIFSPEQYYISQNYPNPFNPSTSIDFYLPARTNVELKVFDILGNEIHTLINQDMTAGMHSISFNAKELSSGMYIYRITAGDFVSAKKMILLK